MRRLIVLVALLAAGCGSSSSPVAPTPVVPTCQSQNTATVYFQNRSNSNLTYDIVWDGTKIATVAPGADSQVFTYAANIQHSMIFRFTNTSVLACNSSTPVLTTCAAAFYGCSG